MKYGSYFRTIPKRKCEAPTFHGGPLELAKNQNIKMFVFSVPSHYDWRRTRSTLCLKDAMRYPTTELWQLPRRLRTLVEDELNDGEKIVWIGQPISTRFAMGSIPAVLFGIPWTAFALFWVCAAAQFQIPDFKEGFDWFPLFGIPFVLIGFALLSTPFWMMRKAWKTVYVLTTSRAILFDGGFSTTIRSFRPDRMLDLHRKQRADGSGDLIFERTLFHDNESGRQTVDHGFLAIPDVKAVEDLVCRLVEASANKEA